jgi:SNF2 family DNA or RNA helicase
LQNTSEEETDDSTTSANTFPPFFLYDTEKLREITSDNVIKQGLLYFKENRVVDMGFDDQGLWAYVEGSNADEPYYVELRSQQSDAQNDRTELHVQCACTSSAEPVCKHAVALLLQFADQSDQNNEELLSAQATAIAEREKRGRTEVKVKHLSGKPWFGQWQASSMVSTTHRPQVYTVQIRSLTERANYCTCPDHATNLLGTCKHIEAVLHKINKTKSLQPKSKKSSRAFVYLSWEGSNAPQICLRRASRANASEKSKELAVILDQFFNAAGDFSGQMPEDFFHFTDQVYGRDDLLIGDDASLYARKIMQDATQQAKAATIRQQIMQTNGVLPGIRARLYPYQIEGVAFLAAKGRVLLADDMGLGKTLQAIAAANWLKQNASISKTLIVCPASLKHQWAREIEKFTGKDTQIIQGGPDVRKVQYRGDSPFIVVNYELVMRDLTLINERVRPDLLILDEAQRIKNWRTKIASTIKLMTTRYVFVLTGTPMENRLEDLYSLMQVINPDVLGPLWRYMIDYHVTDERGKVLGYRNLSKLRQRIAPVLLRRERSLVRDQLPDRTQIRLDVPMTEAQIELHGSAMQAASMMARIAARRPLTPGESHRFMAALQQARMACDAAGLVDKETTGSPKLNEMAILLEDLCLENGRKVVIFSQWERMTAMAEEVVKKLKLGCVRLHGGVPTAKRGDLIERFHKDDSISVFLSTDAGGTGLNLQCASALINLDVPWNPAVLEQRNARIHRLGQKEKVQIILMVAEDSYEEKVLALLQNKQNLFDNVIEPDATEDVVGINKKMLQTVIDDLTSDAEKEQAQDSLPASEAEPMASETMSVEAMSAEAMASEAMALAAIDLERDVEVKMESARQSELNTHRADGQDEAISQCVIKIQQTFGSRLEKVMGVDGGLLVVTSTIESNDEAVAEELSETIPVAIIDLRTINGLQRLGKGSPVAAAEMIYDASQDDVSEPAVSPLIELSRRKLKSAEILLEQQCSADAMSLLVSSLLTMAAGKMGLQQAPSQEQASVWLYAEAIPQGFINNEQAMAILRAMTLSQAPSVPESLLYEVLEDVRLFTAD